MYCVEILKTLFFFAIRNVTKSIFTLILLYVAVNCWRPILSGGSSNKVVCVCVCVCVCETERESEREEEAWSAHGTPNPGPELRFA